MNDWLLLIGGIALFLSGAAVVYQCYMEDTKRHPVMLPPPGYVMVQPNFSNEEMRIVAKFHQQLALSQLAQQLKSPDADDPFWNRLCDGEVALEDFEAELLRHFGLVDHPKGPILVKIARKNTDDLQDAYLLSLDLLDLL